MSNSLKFIYRSEGYLKLKLIVLQDQKQESKQNQKEKKIPRSKNAKIIKRSDPRRVSSFD